MDKVGDLKYIQNYPDLSYTTIPLPCQKDP